MVERKSKLVYKSLKLAFCIGFTLSSLISSATAQNTSTTYRNPRFILHIDDAPRVSNIEQIDTRKVASLALNALDKTHEELKRIFNAEPEREVVLRFLSPKEFRKQTGAPDWTSAMFFRDEITIPLTAKAVEQEELERALRHEYVHAFIAQLSDYKCPAWLDEGVAQILEGPANPLLGPAMRKWISTNDAIPLDDLVNGFTTLDDDMVPAAYAQSLFASKQLVRAHGFSSVVDYLMNLKAGLSNRKAFKVAFGRNLSDFQRDLTPQIKIWSTSGQFSP